MGFSAKVPKVLHCVERMHTNAVESWLARMYRHSLLRGRAVNWRFHVQFNEPGRLETTYPECTPLIIRSPCQLSDWGRFFLAFRHTCRTERFDVVHVHADLMSAPYAVAARSAGVRRIVVHVHNADESVLTPNRIKQSVLRPLARGACLAMADRIVGISNHTLDTFLAGRARRPERDSVHYYGVDPAPFEKTTADRARFRRACGLPDDALVLLFGGRLVPEKNPLFAVEVLAHLRRMEPRAIAVFAGAGSQEQDVIGRARELGVENSVRLLGWRNDLPEIMSCSDWFILPHAEHPMEGFGLAVVEAQLAGLRMLLSRGIPDDPLLPTASFRRLALAAAPEQWAHAAMELLNNQVPSRADALDALRESPMNMDQALEGLLGLHT
jgi:glycosyltransferase involved in cell wall biosynthesis